MMPDTTPDTPEISQEAARQMLAALKALYPRLDALPDAARFAAERIVSAAISAAEGR